MQVIVQPLTLTSFKPFGQVIEHIPGGSKAANQGTAKRSNYLAALANDRPDARANLCVFKVTPQQLPFSIRLLEK